VPELDTEALRVAHEALTVGEALREGGVLPLRDAEGHAEAEGLPEDVTVPVADAVAEALPLEEPVALTLFEEEEDPVEVEEPVAEAVSEGP
jgi:hypothetical protein